MTIGLSWQRLALKSKSFLYIELNTHYCALLQAERAIWIPSHFNYKVGTEARWMGRAVSPDWRESWRDRFVSWLVRCTTVWRPLVAVFDLTRLIGNRRLLSSRPGSAYKLHICVWIGLDWRWTRWRPRFVLFSVFCHYNTRYNCFVCVVIKLTE